jgi:hypothetical protein
MSGADLTFLLTGYLLNALQESRRAGLDIEARLEEQPPAPEGVVIGPCIRVTNEGDTVLIRLEPLYRVETSEQVLRVDGVPQPEPGDVP